MSTLAESTSLKLEGYEPSGPRPVNVPMGALPPVPSSWTTTRSPVPPIAISPDSTNIFNASGAGAPKYRIISVPPLFQQINQGNGTTTTVTNTVVADASTSGSSSGGSTPAAPTLSNTAFTTPVISQGVPYTSSFTLAANFLLVQVTVSSAARVELYATSAGQTKDSGRATSVPVSLGAETGLIADLNLLLANELTWLCSPTITGSNGDSPQSSTVYVTVTNQNPSSVAITVGFSFLSLE